MPWSLDSKPTLQEIISFKTSTGETINILEEVEVATYYKNFGMLLLNDETGAVTDRIASFGRSIFDSNLKIVKRWLQGQGKEPVTWSTLIDVLEEIECDVLAQTIKDNLTTTGEMYLMTSSQHCSFITCSIM